MIGGACEREVTQQAARDTIPRTLGYMRYCRKDDPPRECAGPLASLAEKVIVEKGFYSLGAAIAKRVLSIAPGHEEATKFVHSRRLCFLFFFHFFYRF